MALSKIRLNRISSILSVDRLFIFDLVFLSVQLGICDSCKQLATYLSPVIFISRLTRY